MSSQASIYDTEVKLEVKREPGSTSWKGMTMGRWNEIYLTSTTLDEYLRKMKIFVCYTWGVQVKSGNEGEACTRSNWFCAS